MKITKVDKPHKFIATFNTDTGEYMRTGVINKGVDTGIDLFMASYPELIDVGIMGSCAHASQCTVGCYIDYVCKAKDVTTDEIMNDIRSKFKTYDEFLESF